MQKKHWLPVLLVLSMVLAAGGLVLAQVDGATVTVTVLWTDQGPIEGAEVTIYEQGDEQGPGPVVVGPQTTVSDGKVQFTGIPNDAGYEIRAELDEGNWTREGFSHIWLSDEETMDVTLYMLREGETEVFFSVGGSLSVRLDVEEGHDQWIPASEKEFSPSRFRAEAYNVEGETLDVSLTAFTIDGDWDGNLVGTNPSEGEIAIMISEDDVTYAWLGNGIDLTLERPGDVGYLKKIFWIKGVVGEGTQDMQGRVIFKVGVKSE
jgi:hypothetical protein